MRTPSFSLVLAALIVLTSVSASRPAAAQPVSPQAVQGGDLRIVWEVKNRFRLFRQEKDFQLHVAALTGRSVLASEQANRTGRAPSSRHTASSGGLMQLPVV